MKTLDAFLKATHRQGGTIHQAVQYCSMHGDKKSITYKQGLSNGNAYQVKGSVNEIEGITIADCLIPINSFSSPNMQTIQYISGLIDSGIE